MIAVDDHVSFVKAIRLAVAVKKTGSGRTIEHFIKAIPVDGRLFVHPNVLLSGLTPFLRSNLGQARPFLTLQKKSGLYITGGVLLY